MTKTMSRAKYFFAFAAAAILALAMSVGTAWADDEATPTGNTITIKSTATSATTQSNSTTYNWYQILKADIKNASAVNIDGAINGDPGVVAYYVESQSLANLLDATNVFKATKVNDSRWNIELENANANAEDIAKALDTSDIKSAAITHGVATANGVSDVVINGLNDGYYLIVASNGSNLAVQTLGNVTINEKNSYPTVAKTLDAADSSAQIGDTINYTLTVEIPSSADKAIVLTDTMTAGLTFGEVGSVTSKVGDADATTVEANMYSVSNATTGTDGKTSFTITFGAESVKNLAGSTGSTVTIPYTATLNANAVVGSSTNDADGNDNTVELTYNNQYTTKPVTVETDTQSFTFDKVDGANTSVKLSGAVFELYKATVTGTGTNATATTTGNAIALVNLGNNRYRVATSDDANTVNSITTEGAVITIAGVAGDENYALVETQAPQGYNQLTSPFPIQPGTLNTLAAEVANNAGTQLPSTGGMGTTILYVVGAVLVVGAGIFLITKRRVRKETDIEE